MQDTITLPNDEFISKILQNPNGNPLYKKSALILDVIKETLQENSSKLGNSTNLDTAIFSNLFNFIKQSNSKDSFESIDATLFLFNYSVHKVNPAVIQKLSHELYKTLSTIANKNSKSVYAWKYIISIYQCFLQTKTQKEWQEQETLDILNFVLNGLMDEKMKVRKQASKTLNFLLEKGLSKIFSVTLHIQNFVMSIVEDSNINPKQCIYLLYFLNTSLKLFSITIISDICYALIKTLRNENYDIDLATHVYSTLESLMAARPLNADLVEALLKDFLNNSPTSFDESNLNFAYIQCLAQAELHLNTIDERLARSYISPCLLTCSEYILTHNDKLALLACKSIELIINYTIKKNLWIENNQSDRTKDFDFDMNIEILEITDQKGPSTFTKLLIFMKYLLSNRFEHAQKYVLSILSAFFEKLDDSCSEQLTELIGEFINSKPIRPQNLWFGCVGKFLQKMNPEIILKHSPLKILDYDLNLEDYENLSNSWILPLFKKYLRADSIRLFMEYFLPFAQKISSIINTKMKDEFTDIDKSYQILYIQIWELFPKFCKFTKENIEYVPEIFNIATTAIKDQEEIRKSVANGVEILVSYFATLPKYKSPEYIKIHKTLQEYADKLSPILCKVYISQRVGGKNVLSLITALSKLCSQEYLDRVYLKNVQRLITDKANNKLNTHIVIGAKEADLLLCFAPSMELKDAKYDITLKFVKTFLGENNIFQKKAYRLLTIVINKVHESFLPSMLDILNEFKVVTAGARGSRLTCLQHILQKIEFSPAKMANILIFLQKFLPEILVALKESNKKSRKAGIDVIKMLTGKVKDIGYLKAFINMVIGCFAAKTSLMKSAAILGVAHIVKDSKNYIDEPFTWEITSLVLLMIKEQNREVYKSILNYVKILFKVLTADQVNAKVTEILQALFEWDDESRECFKSKIRHLLEKLIRKIGKANVENALPNDHKKLIKYIMKMEKQQKKKKEDKKMEKKNNKIFLEDFLDDETNKMDKDNITVKEYKDQIKSEPAIENENNLLLKFDSLKEKFHFEEHPLAKIKEKQKKEVQMETDVFFNEQTGKIHIMETENTYVGKKRRRENPDEDMESYMNDGVMHVEKNDNETQANGSSRIKKMVKLNNSKALTKEVTNIIDANEEKVDKKPRYNPNVIRDVKVYSNTPDPYALIQLTPKILNKRNKADASKAFEFLISKKKNGALKGLACKMKQ